MYVVSDVGISSNAINEFYNLKAKLMLTTEEMNNLERLKRMNNLETDNQKEYSIAKWIVGNYENRINKKHVAKLHSELGLSESLLGIYFYHGRKYIKNGTPMRAGKKIQGYIDEILADTRPVRAKEDKNEVPEIREVTTNPHRYYGVQVDKRTLKIFETQDFAQCFLDGFNYAGDKMTRVVSVTIGEN